MSKLEEIKQRMKDAREAGAATEIEAVVHFHPDLLALCEEQDRELREAVRLLKRVTTELNRFHLNNKAWIGNPFECPICRMIESADTIIKRHKENEDE